MRRAIPSWKLSKAKHEIRVTVTNRDGFEGSSIVLVSPFNVPTESLYCLMVTCKYLKRRHTVGCLR